MKPNNSGGRTFQNEEVPVVIGAISHHDPELAKRCAEHADQYQQSREVEVHQRKQFKVLYGPLPDFYKDEKSLSLGQTATNMALGHLLQSYEDKVLFPPDQPIARRILLEMGLVKPSFREKVVRFGR